MKPKLTAEDRKADRDWKNLNEGFRATIILAAMDKKMKLRKVKGLMHQFDYSTAFSDGWTACEQWFEQWRRKREAEANNRSINVED